MQAGDSGEDLRWRLGNVYLSTATDEFDSYGVRVFTSAGVFLMRLDDSETTAKSHLGLSLFGSTLYASYEQSGQSLIEKIGPTGTLLGTIGSRGSGEGQLAVPRGLAHDAAGNLYVIDSANNRIQIFDPADAVLDVIGSGGTGEGEFSLPRGVALDPDGNVFVIDSLNNRVQKFRPAGAARRGRASSRQKQSALRGRRRRSSRSTR